MTDTNLVVLGFGKRVFDFICLLQKRFPQRKRLNLVTSRFRESFLQVPQAAQSVLSDFQSYFTQCDAEKNGIMKQEYSIENLRILNSKQNSNSILRLIQFNTIFKEANDLRTNVVIWKHLTRLAETCKFIEENAELIRIANSLLTVNAPLIDSSADVETLLDNVQQVLCNDANFLNAASAAAARMVSNNNTESNSTPHARLIDKDEEDEQQFGVEFIPWTDVSRVKDPDNICCVCFDAEPNTKIKDCDHDSFCYDCMYKLVQSAENRKCPLCRTNISTVYVCE